MTFLLCALCLLIGLAIGSWSRDRCAGCGTRCDVLCPTCALKVAPGTQERIMIKTAGLYRISSVFYAPGDTILCPGSRSPVARSKGTYTQ